MATQATQLKRGLRTASSTAPTGCPTEQPASVRRPEWSRIRPSRIRPSRTRLGAKRTMRLDTLVSATM